MNELDEKPPGESEEPPLKCRKEVASSKDTGHITGNTEPTSEFLRSLVLRRGLIFRLFG